MDEILLKVNHLNKIFYNENGTLNAIKDVSFTVSKGEFLSIVGTSGCGKSTLLNILAGIENKTSGEIIFNKKNCKIGYMFQVDALLDYYTIFENAILGLKLLKEDTPENILYTKNLLIKYGLEKFMDKYPCEISGGMKQRVA